MLEKIRNKIGFSLIDKKTLSLTSPELYSMFRGVYSMMFQPGQPVYSDITTTKAIHEGYKLAIPIYRGIRAVIQAISGIPWYAADKNDEPIENHPFTKVWARPNPEFSGQDHMEYISAWLMLGGNAYLRPIYQLATGQPQEFWLEMPDLIAPIPSDDKNKWIEGWEYTLSSGKKITLKKDVLIQFRQIDPGSFYVGMGAIQTAGRVIETYNEGIDTQKVSMQNRGLSSGLIYPEEPLDSGQFDDFKKKFRDNYLDKSSRREPWLFPRKIGWIETSQTPVELDYNQSQLGLIRQMAAAIGIDPWWVGDREHSSFNNVKEARKSLYEDVGIPILDDIKATLNLKLAPLYGDGVTIKYDLSNVAALREDFGQKVTQAQTLWQMGVPMSQINTVLEVGLEEYPGWDRSYLPFSVSPVSSGGRVGQEEEEEGEKSIKLTEDELTIEWKRVDSRRVAYWSILQKKFEPLYKQTGSKVVKALGDKPDKKKISKAIDSTADDWLKMVIATNTVIIEDFGKQTEIRLKTIKPEECKFDPFAGYVQKWLREHAAESVKSITGTLKEDMAALIAKATEDGLSVSQIASVIREYYDDRSYSMAMRIARTETASAAGYAQHQTALDLGFTKKRWISARDDRTRDSHVRMDGEPREINTRYSNGLMYPGDPSGNAEEVIHCRCTETWER